jgi:hypothetical protein
MMNTKGSMEASKAVMQILLSYNESPICPELFDYPLEAYVDLACNAESVPR